MAEERKAEKEEGRGQEFYLALPGEQLIFPGRTGPPKEKTALWVPFDEVVKNGFSPSKTWPEVLVSRDVLGVLKTSARFGQTSPRSELEDDPGKQQLIFYTAITCRNHLLFYQRAGESTTKLNKELLGDERLRGKYSIGVGGHKTEDDILSVETDLLKAVVPLVADDLRVMIGINRGFLAEVEEEVGIGRLDFAKSPRILGAFMDRRKVKPEDPRYQSPIGFVHLALPTVVEVSPERGHLTFHEREIAYAQWVPFSDIQAKLEEILKSPFGVDSWTEVFIREYLPEIIA